MTIELLPFQTRASSRLAERFLELLHDDTRPYEKKNWAVPFYQALSALPGAGKTPILADAVSQIRASVGAEPVVLWISKAKAVVDQTRTNFSPGGKYEHLIEGFIVYSLAELGDAAITDGSSAIIALATVGSFNQKDRADGTLRVHKVGEDSSSESLWTALRERRDSAGKKRPLVIVYDEGHNLSDQQTDLLVELEPDAILVASATMKTPGRLGKLIDRLREHGWAEEKLITSVSSKDVVDAGLVKRQVVLGGYATIMEAALDDMIDSWRATTAKAHSFKAGFSPKAIYVCKTNISQDDGTPDNHARPFEERRAPPILIWRHLLERGIDPKDIAVYCDLKFERKSNPPPPEFNLFSGGEEDFAEFTAGDYKHIIFNLSLQEGWDDAACAFAYIDKSMGSAIQVEQVIGRLLRQPGAQHFPDPDLNTASFYIRVDDKGVFPKILDTVRRKIAADIPEVKLNSFFERRDRSRARREPKGMHTVPEIHIDSSAAVDPLIEAIRQISDYRADTVNTSGKGELVTAVQKIGDDSAPRIKRQETAHANRVMARWIARRGMQALYPEAVKTIDWANLKFDACVEMTSPAAIALKETAEKLVDIYLAESELVFEAENLYTVGPVIVDPKKSQKFSNAVHEAYSDMSPSELTFARVLDDTGLTWARNPSNGGFCLPLLEKGDCRRFFPDFLVWKNGVVFALDPKGEHLIAKDAGIKLLDVRNERGHRKVVVRLFTQGTWQDVNTQKAKNGVTVWALKAGKPKPRSFATLDEAISAALKTT